MLQQRYPTLGILRLDYNYEPAIGDIDHPKSFDFNVIYRVIPGLTFEMCQSGKFTQEVVINCINAVEYLNNEKVFGITGDCGFMINIQKIITKFTDKPVFLSSLIQLPSIINTFSKDEMVAVFTANSDSLNPILDKLKLMCNIQNYEDRLEIVGCQEVPGFDAVAKGEKVDVSFVTPGFVNYAREILKNNPKIKCILLECTEMPPYADSLRYELGIPVYDSITNCNFFMMGFLDNKNFGLNNWQKEKSIIDNNYIFGNNLELYEKEELIN